MSSPSESGEQPINPPQPQGVPTLKPADPFNPKKDAVALHTAMKGFGTDEKTIIEVLCHRTNTQRQKIAGEFKILYNKDLVEALKSELSGYFENLIVALMTPTAEYQANELHRAMGSINTNERALIEMLCTATNQELRDMNAAYKKLYYSTLESHLVNHTKGALRRLFVSICHGHRSEDPNWDPNSVVADAKAMFDSELNSSSDESTFIKVLASRTYPQLKQIFKEYERHAGHGIELAIKTAVSEDIQSALLAMVHSIKDKSGFYAEQLYNSMARLGTWDRTLIRIVSLRSEIDMENIKTSFCQKYKKSLADFIAGDTSGDFKKGLLALIQ